MYTIPPEANLPKAAPPPVLRPWTSGSTITPTPTPVFPPNPWIFTGIQSAVTSVYGTTQTLVVVLDDDIGQPNSAGNYSYIPDALATSLGLTLVDNGATVREVQSAEGWLVKIS